MNRLLISAAHKSSGKTTLSIGLCAALRQRGLTVQAFKKGPDYIDPMWLSLATGRDCHNLDFFLMSRDEILNEFARRASDADISLIEGNKGLYDGLNLDGSNSNAALATLLDTPAVLVIDARGMTRGIAPLILGYQSFDPNIQIAGVILNQLGGSRHESKLRAVIEHYTDVPVLGAVHHDKELGILERHLGLIPSNEATEAKTKIDAIGARIASSVDLDRLVTIAKSVRPMPAVAKPAIPHLQDIQAIRIGIARDAAFGFYYPGDLEALHEAGAELVPFDTLNDKNLPSVDALMIGGGFPEMFMQQLQANVSLRQDIHRSIEAGMPAYAECGGLMYLSRRITWKGETCEMAGVIQGDVVMHERPQGRGYVVLRENSKALWPSIQKTASAFDLHAHEFHYSRLVNLPPDTVYAYDVQRGYGIDGKHDGIVYKNLFACYAHQRDLGNNHWASRFVAFIRQQRLPATSGKRVSKQG